MKNNPEYITGNRKKAWIAASVVIALVYTVICTRIAGNVSGLILLVPPVLLFLVLLFVSLEKYLILTVFLVPLSVQLRFITENPPFDIFIPTELMLLALLVIVVYRVFVRRDMGTEILLHPVSVIIYLILAWIFVTSVTSSLPVVSFKYLATRLWYIGSFYFLASVIFSDPEKIKKYFLAFTAGMTPVVVYFLVRMWQVGIVNQAEAYRAPLPFFLDHTALGAGLAFLIPVMILYLLRKSSPTLLKTMLTMQLVLFSAAFILSYSRAAWISLVIAALMTLVFLSRLSWKIVFATTIVVIAVVITSWTEIIIRLSENRQESSTDIASHLQSIANIRSDASNMERINRWKAALRMSSERPLLGWGPGTYQFNYASYQISTDKTIISTNYGEGGNAHSEYLGALAESGLPGIFLYVLFLAVVLFRGSVIWKRHPEKSTRYLVLALLAGLITYVIHGALNNFLDSDKISALFWGMAAAIVAIDIRMKKMPADNSNTEISSNN